MDAGMDEKQINQSCCANKTKLSLIDEVRSLKERLILKDSIINELLKSNQRNTKVSALLPRILASTENDSDFMSIYQVA